MRFFGAKAICLVAIVAFVTPTLAQSARKDGAPSANSLPANPNAAQSSFAADTPGLLYQGVPAAIQQDEGAAGLRLELLRLGTTARLMQVVAHPDDVMAGC